MRKIVFYERKKMINKIKYILAMIKNFGLISQIFNEAKPYEGPLKTIDKGFKPFKLFKNRYDDPTSEAFKIRVGFRDIVVLKFDMNKLYDFYLNRDLNGDTILQKFIGQYFYNFGLSSGMCSTSGYKFLWLNVKFVFIDSKLYEELNEKNRKFFILHEIGHIVLGHHDEYSKPVFDEYGNAVPVQLVDFEYEYGADTYARGYIKPRDPDNAIKAISKNEFINRSVKDFMSEEYYTIYKRGYNVSLEYEIGHRFAGKKLNQDEYLSFVQKKLNSL